MLQIGRFESEENTFLDDFRRIHLPDGWLPLLDEAASAVHVDELKKEMNSQHVLHGVHLLALARSLRNDDVLFYVGTGPFPLAVVHLTWKGRDRDPNFPWTTFHNSIDDWLTRSQEDFQ